MSFFTMSFFTGTRPVNSVFTDEDGVTLKVVERVNCNKCYYLGKHCAWKRKCGYCASDFRDDHKSVIFVEVKGGQK